MKDNNMMKGRYTFATVAALGLTAMLAFSPVSQAEDLSGWRLPAVPVPANNPQTKAKIRLGHQLELQFEFTPEQVERIGRELIEHGRATPCFEMRYVRSDGKVATRIRNWVAIRPAGYVAPAEHRK